MVGGLLVWNRSRTASRWSNPFLRWKVTTVAVEVIAGLEREERGRPHHHRAQSFVTNIEIVVRETAALEARIR
jgi:hypothetical protein